MSQIPDLSDEAIENMTPREAEANFYHLQGLWLRKALDKKEWFEGDGKFGKTIIKLMERSGKKSIGIERDIMFLG